MSTDGYRSEGDEMSPSPSRGPSKSAWSLIRTERVRSELEVDLEPLREVVGQLHLVITKVPVTLSELLGVALPQVQSAAECGRPQPAVRIGAAGLNELP